jgi:hypothetical protein
MKLNATSGTKALLYYSTIATIIEASSFKLHDSGPHIQCYMDLTKFLHARGERRRCDDLLGRQMAEGIS